MKVEQIYTGCLAQGAYYIESEGEAAVIDPLRESSPYLEKAKESGASIKYVFETHFHADFVSGHLDLAKESGATIVFGPKAETGFAKYQAKDDEEFKLGNVTITVLHTPGHTPESTSYLLRDESGKDYAIFTGDTLFIGDVGRPDLCQKGENLTKEQLAGWLYDSLRNKIMPLQDDVLVYPAHGAGSACGKNMSSETFDTLGHQKMVNYALQEDLSREDFISELTEGILPAPQYFAKNAALNKEGYESFDVVMKRGSVPLSLKEFDTIIEDTDVLALDVRTKDEFRDGHIPGSIFIGLEGDFAPWVGALIPDLKQEIVIISNEGQEQEAVKRLSRVGYDNALGYLKGGYQAWSGDGREIGKVASVKAGELEESYQENGMKIIDVRRPSQHEAEHIERAKNVPLDYVNKNMDKFNREDEYYLHCQTGYRSMIFASILKSRGFQKVVDISGGIESVRETSIPIKDNSCSN